MTQKSHITRCGVTRSVTPDILTGGIEIEQFIDSHSGVVADFPHCPEHPHHVFALKIRPARAPAVELLAARRAARQSLAEFGFHSRGRNPVSCQPSLERRPRGFLVSHLNSALSLFR